MLICQKCGRPIDSEGTCGPGCETGEQNVCELNTTPHAEFPTMPKTPINSQPVEHASGLPLVAA